MSEKLYQCGDYVKAKFVTKDIVWELVRKGYKVQMSANGNLGATKYVPKYDLARAIDEILEYNEVE